MWGSDHSWGRGQSQYGLSSRSCYYEDILLSPRTSAPVLTSFNTMIIERDVAVPMDDGNILRAVIFCPDDGVPASVNDPGLYEKGVPYKDG